MGQGQKISSFILYKYLIFNKSKKIRIFRVDYRAKNKKAWPLQLRNIYASI